VAEPDEERQDDRDRHSGEREDAREHRPAGVRLQEIESGRAGDRRPAREDEHHVAQQEDEGDLTVQPVGLVHLLETAEEPLDRSQPGAQDEVQGERRGTGEREQDRDARQRQVLALEARLDRRRSRPERKRHGAERDQPERAEEAAELVGREAQVHLLVPRRCVSL
jgi:hypothetical protein